MEEEKAVEEAQTSTEEAEQPSQPSEEDVEYLNKVYRKIKHITVAIKIFVGVFVALLAALIVGIIVDGKTPKEVYLIAMLLLSAVWSLSFYLAQRNVKKLQRQTEKRFNLPEDALTGGKKSDKEALKPKADPKKVKDKIYYILTGIALFGDALAVVGVALLASKANVHPAVTVIFILAGALILTVFHIAATVRFFRRKSAAEQKTVPLTDIKTDINKK